ncbi:hypothetical protein [Anaeromicrobium sediminis]|uniref:Yip1 domain-containing protein n=1 Tax=Anaeromicrobium sediminis TaxID=1478221 RepID=A0A267ML77_9FIRM|nr:hypothetical protein [Anaeromicrobium sediminis]PAB60341.1 hypothetical protein CCE28_05450 [Anaeromicrobium sediminis]
MNFVRMTYEKIIESDDLKSYDNKGLTIFIAFGIIGQLLRVLSSGQLIDATSIEIAIVFIKGLFVGFISHFILYYLNGAVTSFVSSKLGGVASNVETRIGHAIGLFPFLVLNVGLLILHIILLAIGYLTSNLALTLINHGPDFEFIEYLRNTCRLITVGLTSYTIARINKFGLVKGFISCYWFLLLALPLWLFLLFKSAT